MAQPLEPDNPFWRFSLAVYSAPDVADECLALQDALGIDVNLLLFCAWLGAERKVTLGRAELEEVRDTVRDWHERIVRPLRHVRQALKTMVGDTPLRTQVKRLELEAEQIEQAMMFALAEQRWPRTCMNAAACVAENVGQLIGSYEGAPREASLWPKRLIDASHARRKGNDE